MTYSEKLRHPKWQKKRLNILERDGWTCQHCGNKDTTLHVHHKVYSPKYENPWDYPDMSLITLCEDCHEIERVSRPRREAALKELLKLYFSTNDLDNLINALFNTVNKAHSGDKTSIIKELVKDKDGLFSLADKYVGKYCKDYKHDKSFTFPP